MSKKHVHSSPKPLGALLVSFYRLWHGFLRLKGAGWLIRRLAPVSKSLQNFPLRLPEGQIITLDFRDISAMCWLNHALGETFEETGLLRAMASVITKDSVVWDVGANCGKVSYLLARDTPAKKIVFFEPIISMYEITCAANAPFSNVSGMNVALSNLDGQAVLIIPLGDSSMANINNADGASQIGSCRIDCKTGDTLVSDEVMPAPTVIKIDTEGHETEVVQGLQGVIRKHKPSIFLEHLSLSDSEIRDIVPDGYEIFSVCNKDGSLRRGFDRSKGHNTALLPMK